METLTILKTNNFVVPNPAKIAAFDMDWTLIYPQKGLFPKSENDIALLPERKSTLENFIAKGFTLIVMTNQKSRNNTIKNSRIRAVKNFMKILNLPVLVFISTADDFYRKPSPGMWNALKSLIPKMESAFFVGDAAGRPGDFANSDRKFAENANIQFYIPEEIFPTVTVSFPTNSKILILMVGAPGTKKIEFYEKNLKNLNFEYLNGSLRHGISTFTPLENLHGLKTLVPELILNQGKNLVINMGKSPRSLREQYYQLATKYGYSIVLLYFTIDPRKYYKERGIAIPSDLFTEYFSDFDPPSTSEVSNIGTSNLFYEIDRI